MTEKKLAEPIYYEDVIDLRTLVKTLFQYKWIIIGASVLSALAAFMISVFILPPTYEASAHIGIRRETFYADFEPSIENPSGLEDYGNLSDLTRSLPELAKAEDVWLSVCEQMGMDCTGKKSDCPELDASLLGINQLKLTASCENPQRCAEFANLWAEEVILRWNTLYGNEDIDLDQIAAEVEEARENWAESQAILEAYLPDSRINVVESQLEQAQHELRQLLLDIEENKKIIRDATSLDARLANLPQNNRLFLGDSLSLIALQQRTSGQISGTQFQMANGELLGQGYSVAAARDDITSLTTSLEEQTLNIESLLPNLENKITELVLSLERESYQIDQLTQERDRAEQAYHALARHLDEVALNLHYQGKSAYLLAQARIPDMESGISTVLVLIACFILTGVIVSGGVLVYKWWNDE